MIIRKLMTIFFSFSNMFRLITRLNHTIQLKINTKSFINNSYPLGNIK